MKTLEEKIKKLIPTFIDREFDAQGDTSEKQSKDIKVICKLFNPGGAGTWYLYDRESDKDTYWCFANLGDKRFAELGTVSITELAEIKGMFGLGIERDKFFEPGSMTVQEVMDKIEAGEHV